MKNFPRALRAALSTLSWSSRRLSRAAGLTESNVSRILSGQTPCMSATLGRILRVIKDESLRYNLALNFLLDELPAAVLSCVAISPVVSRKDSNERAALAAITGRTASALRHLAAKHPSVLEDVLPGIVLSLGWTDTAGRK